MRSPASAMAWEILRKNRREFLLVLALLPGGILIRILGLFTQPTAEFISGMSMGVSFLAMFAVFSCVESNAPISFPVRTFTLPVPTRLLVNCPMVLGALGITMLHAVWAFLFLIPRLDHYPFNFFAVFWVVALLSFQAIVWCLADHARLFVGVMIGAIAIFGRLAVSLTNENHDRDSILCLWILLPLVYLGARVGIHRRRHGQTLTSIRAQAMWERVAGAFQRSKRPFSTPAQAQLWAELRRNAVAPLMSLGAGLVLACAGFIRFGSLDEIGFVSSAWFYFYCCFLTLWAFVSSLLLARNVFSSSLAASSFLAIRPVTSGELAFAKIKLTGLVMLAGWIGYAVGVFVWFAYCRKSNPWVDGGLFPTMGFVAISLAWQLVGALPLWLTGRVESAAWAGLLLLAAYIALGNVLELLDKLFGLPVVLPWLLGLALTAKLLIAAWSFRRACDRGLMEPRAISKYVLFWFVGTVGLVGIGSTLCRKIPIAQPLVALMAALFIPLARVGLAPLAMAWGRHR